MTYLKAHPCFDCGEQDPVVLEFDHVADKSAGLAALVYEAVSVKRIRAEIEKCEVVCANAIDAAPPIGRARGVPASKSQTPSI